MALKFLNKKGWHTGSLRNIENVWKAEQKADAEKRKLEELQKQIREEQDQYEFRKLQEQAGLVPRQERLDFMYESGLGVGKPSNDEYLLGKPLEESKGEDVLEQVSAAPGSLFVEEKISANDQWRKIRSDPLLLIKQQELAARERIKNNPLKMDVLRKEVELQKKIKQEKKAEKKAEKKRLKAEEKLKRKELKRKQKMGERSEERGSPENEKGEESRKRLRHDSPEVKIKLEEDGEGDRRRRHDSPASDDERDRSRDKAREEPQEEDRKPGRTEDKLRREVEDRKPSRSEDARSDRRRRYDSPASDDDVEGDRKRSRYQYDRSRRSPDRSRHQYDRSRRSPDRSERRRSPERRDRRSPERRRSPRRSPDRNERRRSPRRSPERDERRRSPSPVRDQKGSPDGRIPKRSPRKSPDRSELPRSSGKPPLPRKKAQLSAEEKEARLREMQRDAELHEEQRWNRLTKAKLSDAAEAEKDSIKSSKNFLNEANRSLYGAEDDGSASVADTLHRRSHYREKFTDTNAFRKS